MSKPKRALIIGINEYDHLKPLKSCVNDALAMQKVLERHENGDLNYECRVLMSPGAKPVTRGFLRQQWNELFENFSGDVLFYFSGHGTPTSVGGFLITQDGVLNDPGLPMDELLTLANKSRAKTVLLILDCCFSGDIGNPPGLQGGDIENQAKLREGLTIVAASRSTEAAVGIGGHGVFTQLLLGALKGGAADVRGAVSAAGMYAYVEQALGAWQQRPIYKSHADCLPPVRLCQPAVQDALLRQLPALFANFDSTWHLDPSYEFTHAAASPENVARFDKFKILRNARLLTTEEDKDLYFIALESKSVRLTPLGEFYWNLAKLKRI